MNEALNQVQFDLQREEYRRSCAALVYARTFRRLKFWLLISSLFVVIQVVLLQTTRNTAWFFLPVAYLVLAIEIPIIAWWAGWKGNRAYDHLGEQLKGMMWSVSEQGLLFRNGSNHLNHLWSTFESLIETKEFLLLKRRDVSAYVFPKRAFSDDEHLKYWVYFINRKLSKS